MNLFILKIPVFDVSGIMLGKLLGLPRQGKEVCGYHLSGCKECQLQDKSSGLCHHKKTVTSKSVLKLNSVAGGGFAISLLAQ